MSAPFQVTVAVAGLSWTVTDLDPATPGPTSPLQLGQAVADGELWPAQPDPQTAQFGLVAPSAASVAAVVKGAEVHITYTAPPNPTPLHFDGTATDVQLSPHRYTDPDTGAVIDGVLISVVAVGYLAQLWEEPIYLDEPSRGTVVTSANRFDNLFDATQWAGIWSLLAPNLPDNDLMPLTGTVHKVIDADGDALGPLLLQLLRSWVGYKRYSGPGGAEIPEAGAPRFRYTIAPNLDPTTRTLHATTPWKLNVVSNLVPLTPSAELVELPDGWGVQPDPSTAAADPVIDTGKIERAVTFVQRKSIPNKVVVTYLTEAGKPKSKSVSNGLSPKVKHTIGTDIVDASGYGVTGYVDKLATFYLPEPGAAESWGLDELTWVLYADTPGRLPPPLGSLVTFAPVPLSQNPNGKTWVLGAVSAWTLTLADGRPRVDLKLAPVRGRIDPTLDPLSLTWGQLPATVTWDQLKATDTWDDYRLLRGPI